MICPIELLHGRLQEEDGKEDGLPEGNDRGPRSRDGGQAQSHEGVQVG